MASKTFISRLKLIHYTFNNTIQLLTVPKLYSLQNRLYAENVTITASPIVLKQNVSKAMQAYLERAHQHDEFMKIQNLEYKLGKRHLANMMGEDPESFTEEDVDKAIAYLFPSGLHEPLARPMMKPPEQIFPQRKAAEFDETGRPYHSMFYTGRPNLYKLLYDIADGIIELNKYEDQMIRMQQKPNPSMELNLNASQWLKKELLEDLLMETITDIDYSFFENAFNRLTSLPYAYRLKDFIEKYRQPLMTKTNKYEIVKPQSDGTGRMFVKISECLRKSARGDVTVRYPGTGVITINGQDITYFKQTQPREQLLFPLIFTNMIFNVDIEANVAGGGFSGQSGAIRWGIAMGLRSFVSEEMVNKMRLAGLLQRDYRRRERKKPGQEGARRKYTWKKR